MDIFTIVIARCVISAMSNMHYTEHGVTWPSTGHCDIDIHCVIAVGVNVPTKLTKESIPFTDKRLSLTPTNDRSLFNMGI